MTTLWSTIFVLGLLIFVHELGHFLVAKRAGIKVEKFSLGFPPKLIGKKIGDTEYCISWLPLGGYVKMAGEDPDETKITGAPWEFSSKPVWVRGLVIAAGPFMNYLLAVVLIWGVLLFGGRAEVESDRVVVGMVSPLSPAEEAGIKPGDQIISVDGIVVNSFEQMARYIYARVEKPVEVVWQRDGRDYKAIITTFKDKTYNERGERVAIGKIGVGQAYRLKKVGFIEAIVESFRITLAFGVEVVKFVIGLFQGTVSVKMLGGPVFIAELAGQTASRGFADLLTFAALLSVNLALLNILPIPALDGGHLLFLFIEKMRRKPLSLKQRAIIQQIGFALLIVLIVLATYNDFLRLLK